MLTAEFYYKNGKISKEDIQVLIEAKNKMALELEDTKNQLNKEQEPQPTEKPKAKRQTKKSVKTEEENNDQN